MKIYAFIGVVGSGKDFYTNQKITELTKLGYRCKHMNFADTVRNEIWHIFGFKPKDDAEYDLFKKTSIEVNLNRHNNPIITGREFMERFGTDFVRKYDKEFWIKAWAKKVKEIENDYDVILISDCRYDNEVKYLLENFNATFMYCNYISDRYEIRETKPEKFAQRFLNLDDKTDITQKLKEILI